MTGDERGAPVVAIVGAGFSGSLLALHLLRSGPPDLRILLIERRPGFARGLAYGANDPSHLLNVRVGNMSAWPDRPGHLLEWLAGQPDGGAAEPSSFITRQTYGRYLAAMLQAALSCPDGARRLVLVHDEATRVEPGDGRPRLTFAMGRTAPADAVVLALGNPPPAPPVDTGLEGLSTAFYAPDPWAASALADLDPDAPVALLGTGLTMVDIAVALAGRGHRGPLLAISRRGLVPRRHQGFAPIPQAPPIPPTTELSTLTRHVRGRARTIGWRAAIDELRPVTQLLWRGADLGRRRRFLRHLRPWWDAHRHRMAPAVAETIEAMRADGRLIIAAGRIVGAEADAEGVALRWRPRGRAGEETFRAARIVNATGAGSLRSRSGEPLVRGLIDSGAARADALGMGLDVDDLGRLIDARGRPDARLYAVGPITRGVFWEIVAVPDIRTQVADLAMHLGRRLAARAPA